MRGSTNTSSIREGPATAVKRSATSAVPSLSAPPTSEPVSIGSVGSIPRSRDCTERQRDQPERRLVDDLDEHRREQRSLRAKKRNVG